MTTPHNLTTTTTCPECGGPAIVWADHSRGVTVNFACDYAACPSGKPPWDTPRPTSGHCVHCERAIIFEAGYWVDPEATGDDSIWRETCDSHDTLTAEHEVGG